MGTLVNKSYKHAKWVLFLGFASLVLIVQIVATDDPTQGEDGTTDQETDFATMTTSGLRTQT